MYTESNALPALIFDLIWSQFENCDITTADEMNQPIEHDFKRCCIGYFNYWIEAMNHGYQN